MANKQAPISYEFLDPAKNFLYQARETGKTHTSFQYELILCRAIQRGDMDGVKAALEAYQRSGLIIGHMSDNPFRKIHYWAVATIGLAIHYAILGGLDESEAYQLSDEYIQKIDGMETMEDCIQYLSQHALDLAQRVRENSIPQGYSALINRCVHYIHVNLHNRLRIQDLAAELHVSRDYLSRSFRQETGMPLHRYILEQKLVEAQKMLASGMSINDVSYTLCFCSQSHFIQAFKQKYQMTPAAYIKAGVIES